MTTTPSPIAIPYRPVRQREIAERAGVSVSTVSRVLSGSAGIGSSVRARVLEAATQLGHPSGDHVGALRHVGLFVSDRQSLPKSQSAHPFHADILTGAEAECRARGIQLSYTVIDWRSDGEALIRECVERGRLDALLFFELDDRTLLERILSFELPVVVINAEHPGVPVDTVVPDNEGGAHLAANHLIDNGHRRILHIAQLQRPTRARRARAFQAALAAAGLGEDQDLMLVPKQSGESAGEELLERLERLGTAVPDFTAVFCWDDTAAVHILRALQSQGYDVPRDVSVIGFNDLPFAALLSPALTTVRIEGGELGRVAVRRLVERAQTPSLTPVQFSVATRLIVRQSVAPVPI
jgi:DNA-binding LacI/PurR family transcriptional regulator